MKDSNGAALEVGDTVVIQGQITALLEAPGDYRNVTVKTAHGRHADGEASFFTVNTAQLLLVDHHAPAQWAVEETTMGLRKVILDPGLLLLVFTQDGSTALTCTGLPADVTPVEARLDAGIGGETTVALIVASDIWPELPDGEAIPEADLTVTANAETRKPVLAEDTPGVIQKPADKIEAVLPGNTQLHLPVAFNSFRLSNTMSQPLVFRAEASKGELTVAIKMHQRDVAIAIGPGQVCGRNEPCPCGSGKKFKHCCREKGDVA